MEAACKFSGSSVSMLLLVQFGADNKW